MVSMDTGLRHDLMVSFFLFKYLIKSNILILYWPMKKFHISYLQTTTM